ncbi:MAG TPA: sigma-54 dependent transcriptional regulator [Bryobacteraceae bacterium]|nr:sigma-54 dependent transcriptional regulator [Bryobacteraceae bacterium]
MSVPRVLVADADRSVRDHLRKFLSRRGYEAQSVDSGAAVLAHLRGPDHPSLIILGALTPGAAASDVLSQMKKTDCTARVIMFSGAGHTNIAAQALKSGAAFLKKPFDEQELELAIGRALGHPPPTPCQSTEEGEQNQIDFVSPNPRVRRILELADRIADTDVPVLIEGETGVGKEVLARFIHARSERRHRPLIKINCAAIPHDLLESELFGYERGAFTGALCEKPGQFELANHGALLLDEIGEMSPRLQAKLLHVLQDREFMRLGGTRLVQVDVRILAATNKKLEELIARGEFRQDLFYRLNVIRLAIPPLRERLEDLSPLCEHFQRKFSAHYSRPSRELPEELRKAFACYAWPGNIRELENMIRRFVLLPDLELALADLHVAREPNVQSSSEQPHSLREVSARATDQAERELVLRTLEQLKWNRKQAARELHICYKSLLNKLRRWQIPGRSQARTASFAARAGGAH